MKNRKPKIRAGVEDIKLQMLEQLAVIRDRLPDNVNEEDPDLANAVAHIESFCAVAIRVMAQTNPSKIRSAALDVEIIGRMNGADIVE